MGSVSDAVDLPPGFRFHPTDEEIITHYLSPKVVNPSFSVNAIGEVDLNKCEPWDIPSKAKMGGKDWYFFCKRDRKYPTGMRTNRATESGYWKATGKDKEIFRSRGVLVGMRKTLVFYMGRAPKGEKTNWVMHEFRLEGKQPPFIRSVKDEWVVCKVYHKSMGAATKKSPITWMNSFGEELPPLMDPEFTYVNNNGGLDYYLPSVNQQMSIFHSKQASDFYSQIQTATPHSPLPNLSGAGYLHQDLSAIRTPDRTGGTSAVSMMVQCKEEKFLSHSLVTQEAELSTETNSDITSLASNNNFSRFSAKDVLDDPGEPVIDIDNMWKY